MVDASEVPGWLSALLTEKFFNACTLHEDARKNEKNVFCLDCCEGICPDCFVSHSSHRLLQIRRYVYHDVIRLVDADKLMDCSQVQSYTINSAKVVFLKQRPQTRPPRASTNPCITCERNLQDSFLHCSISCKLQHILKTGSKLSTYLRKCEFLALPEPGLDDVRMTPDSFLEQPGSGGGGGAGFVDCPNLGCTARRDVMKRTRNDTPGSRSGLRLISGVSRSMMNRRKGKPHRSPLR